MKHHGEYSISLTGFNWFPPEDTNFIMSSFSPSVGVLILNTISLSLSLLCKQHRCSMPVCFFSICAVCNHNIDAEDMLQDIGRSEKGAWCCSFFMGSPKYPFLIIVCDYHIAKGEEKEVFFSWPFVKSSLKQPKNKQSFSSEAPIQSHPIISHQF